MAKIVHWEDAPKKRRAVGDIDAEWTLLGEAAGTKGVGVRRMQVAPGKRPTPWHVHGAEEEIFFVLGGDGLLLQGERSCAVSAGDAIVHLPATEPHTLRAGEQGLDALVFGTRVRIEVCHLPRTGKAWAFPTVLATKGIEDLFTQEAEAGVLDFGEPGERPANVVAMNDIEPDVIKRPRCDASDRNLGDAAGSRDTGLSHVTLAPNAWGYPQHCHSAEEEIFVVLGGSGFALLGEEEHPLRPGHVLSCPPGDRTPHALRAGDEGLEYLAYGTRVPNDLAYYPRSGKVFLRGLGVIGRLEPADYWDGED